MPSKNTTPLEEDECRTLVEWMDWNGLKFSHMAQETYTKSWKQKAKNTALGVRKGVPDYLVIIPQEKSASNLSELIFIEMKRQNGGRLSEHQKEWIEAIKDCCTPVYVCYGADEAIDILSGYIK